MSTRFQPNWAIQSTHWCWCRLWCSTSHGSDKNLMDTLPWRNTIHPILSWLLAASVRAADISRSMTKFAIRTWPLWRRYSVTQKTSSESVWWQCCIHKPSFLTYLWNNWMQPGSVHRLRCWMSSPWLTQFGHLSSGMSWIRAVFFCVAHTPIACLDNHRWNPSDIFLIACASAVQSTLSNASSSQPKPLGYFPVCSVPLWCRTVLRQVNLIAGAKFDIILTLLIIFVKCSKGRSHGPSVLIRRVRACVTASLASMLHVVFSWASTNKQCQAVLLFWWLLTHSYWSGVPGISCWIARRAWNRSAWVMPGRILLCWWLALHRADLLSQIIFPLADVI